MNPEQLRYRFDFKLLCFQRAIEAADYDKANIVCAQAEYIGGKLGLLPAVVTELLIAALR